jgi:hypothetical protein
MIWSVMERLHAMNCCISLWHLIQNGQKIVTGMLFGASRHRLHSSVPLPFGLSGTEIGWPGSRAGVNPAQLPFVRPERGHGYADLRAWPRGHFSRC